MEKYHFLKDEPKKRQFDIFNLAEYQKQYATDSSKPHSHSFYQIIWFKNNKGKHFLKSHLVGARPDARNNNQSPRETPLIDLAPRQSTRIPPP